MYQGNRFKIVKIQHFFSLFVMCSIIYIVTNKKKKKRFSMFNPPYEDSLVICVLHKRFSWVGDGDEQVIKYGNNKRFKTVIFPIGVKYQCFHLVNVFYCS